MKLSREHQKKVRGTFTQWRSFAEGFTGRLLEKATRDNEEIELKLRKLQQQDSGLESIDDMEDLSEEDGESNNESEPGTDLILQSNELVSLKRYKTDVKEKINEFLKQQDSKREKLKESSKIDASSFNQGRLAANQYSLTRKSTTRLCLT